MRPLYLAVMSGIVDRVEKIKQQERDEQLETEGVGIVGVDRALLAPGESPIVILGSLVCGGVQEEQKSEVNLFLPLASHCF